MMPEVLQQGLQLSSSATTNSGLVIVEKTEISSNKNASGISADGRVVLTASAEAGARIEIEGKEGTSLSVKLKPGENTFTATAVDLAGNNSTARVSLTWVEPQAQPDSTEVEPGKPALDEAAAGALPFIDVKGHWALGSIVRMVDLSVVRGYEDTTFRPQERVSRLEFAVMVARLLKLTPAEQPLNFVDNDRIPEWARAQMSAAVQAGIITGRPDGSFDPTAPVTRAEMAVMLVRALKLRGLEITPGSAGFGDEIPAWARDLVLVAARYGLVTGYEDATFRANNSATRAEAVTMLTRLQDLLSR